MEKKSKVQENRILEAAQERFARFGYSKVTMDEIAGDIQMGKASLYYYFSTKDKLFQAVIESEQNEFVEEIENIIVKNLSASDKLIEYAEKRYTYFEKFLNLGTLHLHSVMDSKSLHKNYFEEFNKKELKLLTTIINEGVRSKEFKKEILSDLPRVILHIQLGFRVLFLRKNYNENANKILLRQLRNDMRILMKILIDGIKN